MPLLCSSPLHLLVLRSSCSRRHHGRRARESALPPASLERRAEENARESLAPGRKGEKARRVIFVCRANGRLRRSLRFVFFLSLPLLPSLYRSRCFAHAFAPETDMAAATAGAFAVLPSALLPQSRRVQPRRGPPSSTSSSSFSRSSSISDLRRRYRSSSSLLLARPSVALHAAPADGPVVCLGEGLFGKGNVLTDKERERRKEEEKHQCLWKTQNRT